MITFWNVMYFVTGFAMGHLLGVPLGNLINAIVAIVKEARK